MKTLHPTYLFPVGQFDRSELIGQRGAEPRYVPAGTEIKVIKPTGGRLCVRTTQTALPFYGWIDLDKVDWETE